MEKPKQDASPAKLGKNYVKAALNLDKLEGRGFYFDDQHDLRICSVAFDSTTKAIVSEQVASSCNVYGFQFAKGLQRIFIFIEEAKLDDIETLWAKIPLLIDALHKSGLAISLFTRYETPLELDEPFSLRTWELNDINHLCKRHAQTLATNATETDTWAWRKLLLEDRRLSLSRLWHTWNWATPEGKRFCATLRAALGKPPEEQRTHTTRFAVPWFEQVCRERRILHRGGWSSYEPSLAQLDDYVCEPARTRLESVAKRQRGEDARDQAPSTEPRPQSGDDAAPVRLPPPDDAESDFCVICKTNPPQTILLPCGHSTVCLDCSKLLERDPLNSRRCVICRSEIAEILKDEPC